MNLFDLMAKISLDTSEYEEGLDSSEKKGKSFAQSLGSGMKTAAKVGGIAIGAVATGAVALGTAMVKGTSELAAYGDNVDKMSQKMGLSAQAYQEWDAIMQHSGTSIDSMQRGMMTLSNAAVNNSEAFQQLGISQEEVASMSREDLFAATITGLQGMEEGSERAALAQQLLGGAAKELGPLLNTSAEETEAMRQRVHELGGVMSDEAVKAAAAYQDSLQDMNTSIDGLKRGIVTNFLPGITSVMDGLTAIFSGDSGSGTQKITQGISDMIKKISDGMPQVIKVGGDIMKGLLGAISENLPTILEQGTEIILMIATGIIENLPQLVESGVEIILQLAGSIADSIPTLIPTIVDVVLSIVNTLIDNAPELVTSAVEIMVALAGGLISAIPELIAKAPEIINSLVNAVIESAPSLVDAGIEMINNLVDGLTSVIDTVKNVFDFSWSLPDIALPHFSIGDGPSVLGITLPKIIVSWYKKAYEDPYMFTSPTVMATAGGLKGFGDGSGGEIVYGRDRLMQDIREAVGSMLSLDIKLYLDGDKLVGGTSDRMDGELGQMQQYQLRWEGA